MAAEIKLRFLASDRSSRKPIPVVLASIRSREVARFGLLHDLRLTVMKQPEGNGCEPDSSADDGEHIPSAVVATKDRRSGVLGAS